MFSQTQLDWIAHQEADLKSTIEKNWPLDDSGWNEIALLVEKKMKLARNDPDIRDRFFTILEEYENKITA